MACAYTPRGKIILLVKQKRHLGSAFCNHLKLNFSSFTNSEYTDKPEYPQILDLSRLAVKKRESEAWHEKIKLVKTVEEKLFATNLPKYYGWKSLSLNEGDIPYNSLAFIRYITRTHFIRVDDLPITNENERITDDVFNKIKQEIKDVLLFEYKFRRRKHEFEYQSHLTEDELENIITSSLIQQINRVLMANLNFVSPHLLTSQIDYEPRVEAFWIVGGIEPTWDQRKARKNTSWFPEEEVEEPIDRPVQYIGCPILQLRHEQPLSPFSDQLQQPEACSSIEHFKFDPRCLGFRISRRNGTNIPGFWPGDECEFGLISFHRRGYLHNRRTIYGTEDEKEALDAQAILASYGWLLPQACYKGFSTFSDVTYPFVTQTVVTDGQHWSFYVYQLNTTLVHSDFAVNNPRCNLCWGTEQLKLFNSIEDDEIVGFSDEVLKRLIALYSNQPKERQGVELRPYLEPNKPWVAHIEDPERRDFLETRFKHMYSCRPRHRLPYELYHWEKIYKVDHKTRPMDARRRPFELEIDPYKRRYDEHVPEYLPKAQRPENDRKTKWKKTYYPLSKNEFKNQFK